MKKEIKYNVILSFIFLLLLLVITNNKIGSLGSSDFNKILILSNLVQIFIFCIYLLILNRFEFIDSIKEFKYYLKTKIFIIYFILSIICLSVGYLFVFNEINFVTVLFLIIYFLISLSFIFCFIQVCQGKSKDKVNLYFWTFVSINLTIIYLEINFSIPEINIYNPLSGIFFGFSENFEINFISSFGLLVFMLVLNYVLFNINKSISIFPNSPNFK